MNKAPEVYTAGGPSKKLGVKYLDDIQLTNSFPDWRALLQRIEEQRQIAEKAPKNMSVALESHYPQMYDNVYAVLGGRGTGKSSVVLTLRNKMRTPCDQDILLPIITPEIISGRECSILGWIMSATESVVVELENRIQRLDAARAMDTRLDGFFKDCQFQKENPLRKSYRDLFKKSVQSTSGIDISGYSAEDAVGYKAEQSRRQYKLIQDLNCFWFQLTDCWYKVNLVASGKTEAEQGEERIKHPLIILIFDDIDLVPERSMELLTTTFQYFTNPNIVIILTAAEKVLQDVIRLKMFERMVGSESSSLMLDAFPDKIRRTAAEQRSEALHSDSIERLASEFYNKVIPPSSRYLLHRYQTIQERMLYSYSQMEQSFIAPQGIKSIPIEKFLVEQVNCLKDAFAGNGGSSTNFLCGGRDGETFRKAYLTIFGDKSRNIANGCLAVLNTVMRLTQLAKQKQLELSWEDNKETLQSLRYLAQTLMFSKPELNEYAAQVSTFLQMGLDQQKIIVNYEAALECYQKERQEIRDWIAECDLKAVETGFSRNRLMRMEEQKLGCAQKKVAALITLLFFIEGLLLTMDGSRKQLHGYRVLNRLLNADVIRREGQLEDLPLFPRRQCVEDFLDHYPLVLEHIDRYVGVELYSRQFARDYLDDNCRARMEQEKPTLQTILKNGLKMNRDWVKTVLTMLAVRYSGITLFEASFLKLPDGVQEKMALFTFAHKLEEARKVQAQRFLAQSDLPGESKRLMEEFNTLVKREHDWNVLTAYIQESSFDPQSEYSLQRWNDQYEGLKAEQGKRLQDYLLAYTSYRWKDFMQKEFEEDTEGGKSSDLAPLEQCYALVRFVDNTLAECFHIVCTKTEIFLGERDFEAISTCLYRLDNVTEELRKKKDDLTAALRLAASRPADGHGITSDTDGQIRISEQLEKEEIWRIPASPLIEYLLPLHKAQLKQQQEDDDYMLFSGPDLSGYFTLIEYLGVTLPAGNGPVKIGGISLPLSWCIITDLNMIEYLLPYYFAAKMELALDGQDPNEIFQGPDGKGNGQKTLDEKLKDFFLNISKRKTPSLLAEVMQEAQEELSKSYYNYLEGRQ